MIFNNFNELKEYVEKANKQAIKKIAEEEKDILKDEVIKQVYEAYTPQWTKEQWGDRWQGRTGDTLKNINYILKGNSIILKLKDTRSWYSVYDPNNTVYAFEMLEQGHTWARPQTNIKEVVIDECRREIPLVYKSSMRKLGIPIK